MLRLVADESGEVLHTFSGSSPSAFTLGRRHVGGSANISREHCTFRFDGRDPHSVIVEDHDTKDGKPNPGHNCTYVDRRRIRCERVWAGSSIRLGGLGRKVGALYKEKAFPPGSYKCHLEAVAVAPDGASSLAAAVSPTAAAASAIVTPPTAGSLALSSPVVASSSTALPVPMNSLTSPPPEEKEESEEEMEDEEEDSDDDIAGDTQIINEDTDEEYEKEEMQEEEEEEEEEEDGETEKERKWGLERSMDDGRPKNPVGVLAGSRPSSRVDAVSFDETQTQHPPDCNDSDESGNEEAKVTPLNSMEVVDAELEANGDAWEQMAIEKEEARQQAEAARRGPYFGAIFVESAKKKEEGSEDRDASEGGRGGGGGREEGDIEKALLGRVRECCSWRDLVSARGAARFLRRHWAPRYDFPSGAALANVHVNEDFRGIAAALQRVGMGQGCLRGARLRCELWGFATSDDPASALRFRFSYHEGLRRALKECAAAAWRDAE